MFTIRESYECKHVHFTKGYYYKTRNCGENTYFAFKCIAEDNSGWVRFKVLFDNDLEEPARFNSGIIIEYFNFSTVIHNKTTKRISEAKALAMAL